MHSRLKSKVMSPQDAAELVVDGDVVATSGFTAAGNPKLVPGCIAEKARRHHAEGRPFRIALYTGASTGDELDGELTRASAISHRVPYQSNPDMRAAINAGDITFADLHLSHLAQYVRSGFLKKPTVAIVDAVDVTPEGHIHLSASGGSAATFLMMADRIIIEHNTYFGDTLRGVHDVYVPGTPPQRERIPIYKVDDRIGTPHVAISPDKIAAIVVNHQSDTTRAMKAPDDVSEAIADHLLTFLKAERRAGRLLEGLPFQAGVGNVANAVLAAMARDTAMGPLCMYTEVIQDSLFDLIDNDKLLFASGTALTLSQKGQERYIRDHAYIRDRIVLRQQEISNHPEIIRRLGLVAMNTALEMDIFGNVNSTHVMGSIMMNGVGGSGDFTRNAYLPIFMTASIAKNGAISSIVPMVTHVDHNEHSTKVFVTEQGLADVRGMSPVERARTIIENCAHPDYKPLLRDYLAYGLIHAPSRHTPHVLEKAFDFHHRYRKYGSMKAHS